VPRADPERRRAAVERLRQLQDSRELTTAHVRLAASGLGVAERTAWRWLSPAAGQPDTSTERAPYQLSEADREAYARYRGNVAAVHRARSAVLANPGAPAVLAAGVPVPASLCEGWREAPPVTRRTLQRAFRRELTAAEAAARAGHRPGHRPRPAVLPRAELLFKQASARIDPHGQGWTLHQLRHFLFALFPCGDSRHRRASGPAACAV
jgi:putative transposase